MEDALCEHHAHSLCDSHGGQLKQLLKRLGTSAEDGGGRRTPEETKVLIEAMMKRTHVVPFGSFDRQGFIEWAHPEPDRKDFGVRPFDGIRSVGHIKFIGVGQILCRTLTACCVAPDSRTLFWCSVG